jgi:hypothetical protein
MKKIQVPGAAWVLALAIINTLPMALNDAFPGAVWVPLVVDLLLVAAKAIQTYMPKEQVVVIDGDKLDMMPAKPLPANFVAPSMPLSAPVAKSSSIREFLFG